MANFVSASPIQLLGGGSSLNWQTLRVGAGGFISMEVIPSDGTLVVRTDTYGSWLWNPTMPSGANDGSMGKWTQVWTSLSGPSSITSQITWNSNTGQLGSYEIVVCPSNTNHFYHHMDGFVYSSTNRCATWVVCPGWTQDTSAGGNQNFEGNGPYMAVDPQNESILVAGTAAGSCFYTTNGGTTFTAITGLTAPTGSTGYMIAFDPSSTVTGGATQGVYVNSFGTGTYHSTTGVAGTFTLTSGTPTNIVQLCCDSGGNLYAVGSGSQIYKRTAAGTWSTLTTGVSSAAGVAVDPANNNNISVISSTGNFAYSTNAGVGFSSVKTPVRAATDIPWLAAATDGGTLDMHSIWYDPSQSNVLYAGTGVGVFKCTPTATGTTLTWTSQNSGLEQLVSTRIATTPNRPPLLGFFDRPIFTLVNVAKYPTNYGPQTSSSSLRECFGLDYAWNTPFAIGMVANPFANTDDSCSTSNAGGTDGGPSNWTINFAGFGQITDARKNAGTFDTGSCAVSTSSNWVTAMGEGTGTGAASGIWFTTNAGTTWTSPTMTGASATNIVGPDFGWNNSHTNEYRDIICADRVNANTFYAYNYGGTAGANTAGVWKSTNGGSSWTLVFNGRLDTLNADKFQAHLKAMPGVAGMLFFTSGQAYPATPSLPFHQSTNAGTTWSSVSGVTFVIDFGFGAPIAPSSNYTIFIYGCVGGTTQAQFGIWYSTNLGSTWTQIGGPWPNNSLDRVYFVSGDMNVPFRCYVGFSGSGAAMYG